MQIKPAHAFFAPALLAVALALGACGKQDNKDQQQQQQKPPEVGVVTMQPRTVTLTDELPGRTSAFRIAEVRPQVSGILLKRYFTEGADVKAGTQLYQIDPRTYEANVNSAKASLAQAQATLASNRLKAQRYGALVKEQAISKQEADDALSMQRQNEAQVESARAALRNAEINLAYTKVAAPHLRAHRALDDDRRRPGHRRPDQRPDQHHPARSHLCRRDPVRHRSAAPAPRAGQRSAAEGAGRERRPGQADAGRRHCLQPSRQAQVRRGLGGPGHRLGDHPRRIPNPDKLLLPGMFVRAELQSGVRQNALLVPQQGVTRDLKGQPTAMVVNGEGKVEQRILKTERTVGAEWLVTDGLKAGDKVITEGLQKIKPGATVTTKPASNIASAEQKPAGQGQ